MTAEQRKNVEKTITECLRIKFQNYKPKNNYMPFQYRLLAYDRR